MDSLETLQPAKKLNRFDIQSLVNNLPGMAYRCRWSGAWGMEFVSNGSKALTGYAPDELINAEHAWVKLLHPDDLKRVYEEIRTALDQERPFQLVYRIYTRTGAEKWVLEDGRGVSRPGDDPFYLEGFVADITARKHAEESLAEANATINQLMREDPLTGLANRRALEDNLTRAMSFARRCVSVRQVCGHRPHLHLLQVSGDPNRPTPPWPDPHPPPPSAVGGHALISGHRGYVFCPPFAVRLGMIIGTVCL